jgi:hypothetical protein
MAEWLAKLKFPAILGLGGLAFVFLAFYSISGKVTELQLTPYSAVRWIPFIVGVSLILGALATFLADADLIESPVWKKVHTSEIGFDTTFRGSRIHIDFGCLEKIYSPGDQHAVAVLPANEFFDERCFTDTKTATGAFVQTHFAGKVQQLQQKVASELRSRPSTRIEKEPGVWDQSYHVGTCVYLENPLGIPSQIILAAVATKRAAKGLRSEFEYIFHAVDQVREIVADKRLGTVYLPLLGAGKGGLPVHVALFTVLMSVFGTITKEGGYNMKEAHIVVYCPEKGREEIDRRKARRILGQVANLFKEATT